MVLHTISSGFFYDRLTCHFNFDRFGNLYKSSGEKTSQKKDKTEEQVETKVYRQKKKVCGKKNQSVAENHGSIFDGLTFACGLFYIISSAKHFCHTIITQTIDDL